LDECSLITTFSYLEPHLVPLLMWKRCIYKAEWLLQLFDAGLHIFFLLAFIYISSYYQNKKDLKVLMFCQVKALIFWPKEPHHT